MRKTEVRSPETRSEVFLLWPSSMQLHSDISDFPPALGNQLYEKPGVLPSSVDWMHSVWRQEDGTVSASL